jgi:hypothetical protein
VPLNDVLHILDAGSGATPGEREVLGAFHWSMNEVWLHPDENASFHSPLVLEEEMEPDGWVYQLMPCSRLAWSCWNYITRTAVDEQGKKRPTGIIVSSALAAPALPGAVLSHQPTHLMSFKQNMYVAMSLSFYSISL